MSGAQPLLSRAILSDVLDAVESAGIDCDDLLDILPAEVRATLPTARTAKAALFKAIHHLNTWLPLGDRDLPMRILLDAARDMAGPRRERAILESALVELLDGSTTETPAGRQTGPRELFYNRARDSFEASGCKVLMDSPRSDTFIAYRASIVSVVAVCVDSLDRTISAVQAELDRVRRFEPYVEGCVVLPLQATAEHRRLVEIADLRVIEARELRGMDIQDVEAVVRTQLGQLGDAEDSSRDLVEAAYRDFRASPAHLLVILGRESDVVAACRRFVRTRATELLDGLGDCAPLWLRLTEPLPPWIEELAIVHFRDGGVRCSSLGLRRLMNERMLLPVFEAHVPPRRRARQMDLVRQALGPPSRAVLFTVTNETAPGPDLAEVLQLPGGAVQSFSLPT